MECTGRRPNKKRKGHWLDSREIKYNGNKMNVKLKIKI